MGGGAPGDGGEDGGTSEGELHHQRLHRGEEEGVGGYVFYLLMSNLLNPKFYLFVMTYVTMTATSVSSVKRG